MEKARTAVVTGATSGLGQAAAIALGEQGWRVLLVGRDAARGGEVLARMRENKGETGGSAELITGDLFTIAGAKKVAEEIRRRAPALDLLVNSAGGTFSKKELTADGLERTFALNVMAPHVLTRELEPQIAAARGRVVNVVTGIPKGAKASLDELVGDKTSGGIGSYTRSKLALAALTQEQQRRYGERGVTVVSLHPGIIPGTRFGQDIPAFLRAIGAFVAKLFGFGSTLEDAAQRYVLVGTGPVEGGAFYNQGKLAPAPTLASDPAFASSLWQKLESLT